MTLRPTISRCVVYQPLNWRRSTAQTAMTTAMKVIRPSTRLHRNHPMLPNVHTCIGLGENWSVVPPSRGCHVSDKEDNSQSYVNVEACFETNG
jgi:hypothetical protein